VKESSKEEQLAHITTIMISMVTLVLVNDASGRGKAEEAERQRSGMPSNKKCSRIFIRDHIPIFPYNQYLHALGLHLSDHLH